MARHLPNLAKIESPLIYVLSKEQDQHDENGAFYHEISTKILPDGTGKKVWFNERIFGMIEFPRLQCHRFAQIGWDCMHQFRKLIHIDRRSHSGSHIGVRRRLHNILHVLC